jgi:glycosyltransferase involved in cell wall biosynthesis
MKILYFYAEVMGYTEATLKELESQGAELHVVNWDKKKLTPHKLKHNDAINFYIRSSFSTTDLIKLVQSINPDCIVVSGWMDFGYLRASRVALRDLNIPIVCCLDAQWNNTIKQNIARLISSTGILKFFFTNMWVSGAYQYEYARKLNFSKYEIVFDLYSADLALFHQAYKENKSKKIASYPKKFIYVGRFEPVKNINLLLEVWDDIKPFREGWNLTFIGDGSLKGEIEKTEDVTIKKFLTQPELVEEVKTSGCFVLPSHYEPWGVVLHEFAAAGLPIICSDICGASSSFVISGKNGYKFKSNCKKSLTDKFLKIILLSDYELNNMSKASFSLSKRVSPETSAANLISLLN